MITIYIDIVVAVAIIFRNTFFMVSLAAIALIVFDVAGDISLVIHPLLHRKYAYTFLRVTARKA
jgi:hypothetical protein